MQCGVKVLGPTTKNLCKDYAVDNVNCKNLKYQTDELPEWKCDFKFKVSNVTADFYEVKYFSFEFYDGTIPEYCYGKDSVYLVYYLNYLTKPNNPKSPGFDWTWVIVVGSILAVAGILVGVIIFTEQGRNTFNSFKAYFNK